MKEAGHEQDSVEADYGKGKCACVSPISDCRIYPRQRWRLDRAPAGSRQLGSALRAAAAGARLCWEHCSCSVPVEALLVVLSLA